MTTPLDETDYYLGFIRSGANSIVSTDLSLPFFHSCRGEVFRKIISCGRLSSTHCKEFDEELLYLFYGRPAYRLAGNTTTRDLGRFPVCFVLRKDAVSGIRRTFPFDSGAFLANILEEYCGKFASKEEAMDQLSGYDLGNDLDDLAKFIALMYGGDNQYLEVRPKLACEDLKGLCFELSRILDMAQAKSDKIWDNRALTSEVQVVSDIDIDGGGVCAVVLPTQLISGDTQLQEFFYRNNIEVIDYNATRMKPECATDIIGIEVEKHFQTGGVF